MHNNRTSSWRAGSKFVSISDCTSVHTDMAQAPPPSEAPCSVMKIFGMDSAGTAATLVTAVAVHSFLLMILSLRRSYRDHRVLRYLRFGLSAVYLPLMSYVLSYLTTNLWYIDDDEVQNWVLISVILVQFVKAKADLAALAVGATASPAASDDDINSLKVRPSTDSLIYSFWVAGLVIYNIFFDKDENNGGRYDEAIILLLSPLWILGACRMVLRYVAFQRATSSFALGRNVQLIDGYMVQLQEKHLLVQVASSVVPRLIVTGESKQDVEKNPLGYRVKSSALDDAQSTMLITLDRVWSQNDPFLGQQRFKDLCLSLALFKCLRRRFAGCQLTEAGSTWAFHFVHDGLLGREDDHERIFRVIARELAFAREFYYSHLPLASLGALSAALYFLLSMLILAYLCLLVLALLLLVLIYLLGHESYYLQAIAFVLAAVTACIEISDMVASVHSSWTKMSIVGHYIRCNNCCARGIFKCLLRRYKPQAHWKDEIGQIDLFVKQSRPVIKVPPEAKAAILRTFRSSGRQLSAGTAAVQRRCEAFHHDIRWACIGGELTTTTEAILVWCIATSLFDIMSSSARTSSSSSSSAQTANKVVACSLSRYCTYLVVKAPDLLPDNAAWTKRRYKEVKKKIDPVLLSWRSRGADREGGFYHHLIGCFGSESSHEVLGKGSRLGKLLVDEAGTRRSGEGEAGARDRGEAEAAVWELLAEFWSEMLLYLAPSDNVKAHVEVLQRSGEVITLLWALLLHAGITNRPGRRVPEV